MMVKAVMTKPVEIWTIDNFLDPEECRKFIEYIDQEAKPSTVVNVGYTRVISAHRTSQTAVFIKDDEYDSLVSDRCRKFGVCDSPVSEALQGNKYDVGQEFKAHNDYFQPKDTGNIGDLGNRTYTILIYLNDDFEGGETDFPRINMRLNAKIGMALIWNNLYKNFDPNPDTLHSGLPVLSGTKYALVKWFRIGSTR